MRSLVARGLAGNPRTETSMELAARGGFCAPRPSAQPRSRLLKTVALAEKDDSKNGGVNWDKAWDDVRRSVTGASAGTKGPSDYVSGPASGSRFRPKDSTQARIRKQESLLLDVWSQPWFFALMGAAVVGLFVLFVFVIGPPSS